MNLSRTRYKFLLLLLYLILVVGILWYWLHADKNSIPTDILFLGKVTNSQGNPIAGAQIMIHSFYIDDMKTKSTQTDSNGSYLLAMANSNRLLCIEDEQYYIQCSSPHYVTVYAMKKYLPKTTRIEASFQLQKGAAVAGAVFDENANALPGVRIVTRHPGKMSFLPLTIFTNPDGHFFLDGLDPNYPEYSLNIHFPGYRETSVKARKSPQSEDHFDLETTRILMQRSLSRQLWIADQNRVPIPSAWIITEPQMTYINGYGIVTDENGSVILSGFEPDTPIVKTVIFHPNFGCAYSAIPLSVTEPIQILLQEGVRIRGRIIDRQKKAVSGIRVAFHDSTVDNDYPWVFRPFHPTDSAGSFEITGLRKGQKIDLEFFPDPLPGYKEFPSIKNILVDDYLQTPLTIIVETEDTK